LSRLALTAPQRGGIVGNQERTTATLAHGGQRRLGDKEGSSAGDMLRGIEHLYGYVLQQLFLRRQITPFEIAGIQHYCFRIPNRLPDDGESIADGRF